MRPRVLAAVIPVALLVAACSGAATAPSASPTAPPVVSPTVAPTVQPSVAPSTVPPVEPSAAPLSGDIQVVMSDAMRFAPAPITVKAGEEITFVVKNEGVIVHEFFVGSEQEQAEHAEEMAMGGMSHGHDNALSLDAGETGNLTMTFDEPGSLLIGCHEPGHYEAGMKATLTVVN